MTTEQRITELEFAAKAIQAAGFTKRESKPGIRVSQTLLSHNSTKTAQRAKCGFFALSDVSAGTLKRVSLGAADSSGTAFKVLGVSN